MFHIDPADRSSGYGKVGVPWSGVSAPTGGGPKAQAVRAAVEDVVKGPVHLEEFDPRHLHATQTSLTHAGVKYYRGAGYGETGRTYADMEQAGNRFPVVMKGCGGHNVILSGHHRAAAALIEGKQFSARTVHEPGC